MKYQKFSIQLLTLLLCIIPVVSQAIRPAYIAPNFMQTWMLDIHISELRDKNILDENNHISFLQPNKFSLNTIPKEITRIHMYGDGLTKNTTAVIYGNISRNVFEELIIKRVKQSKQTLVLVEKNEITSGTQLITKLIFNDSNMGNEDRVIYYANVTVGIWTTSSNITELRRWMDYPHGYDKFKRNKKDIKLLSFWMKVKPTLKNILKENGEDNYLIQSNILKLTKSFLATIQKSGDYIYFATKLEATNRNKIPELAEIIDSLISTEKENNSSVISEIYQNIKKKQTNKDITISSQVLETSFDSRL